MKTAELKRIVCAGCAQSYRWKPELAGKKAKCKCGKTIVFPKTDPNAVAAPPAPPAVESGEMDLRPIAEEAPKSMPAITDGKCPQCRAALIPEAVICTSCGMNLRTGKRLGTAVAVENPAGQPRGGFAKSSNVSPEGTKAKTMTPKLWLMIGVVIALGAAAAAAHFYL